jgi:hypothetical protein
MRMSQCRSMLGGVTTVSVVTAIVEFVVIPLAGDFGGGLSQ